VRGIENRLHWVQDVHFGQDDNGVTNDNAAVNMAFFNTLSLRKFRDNVLKKAIKYSQILFGRNVKEQYQKLKT